MRWNENQSTDISREAEQQKFILLANVVLGVYSNLVIITS